MKRTLLLLVLALAALPVHAGFREGTSEFEIFAGSHFGDSFTLESENGVDMEMDLEDSLLLGMRGSFFFSDGFSVEMSMSGTKSETWEGQDFDIYYFQGNATYQFGGGGFSPFFTVGMGMALLDHPSIDSDWNWRQENDAEFAWNMGGGFKVYFSREIAFRVDVRAYWINTSEEDYWEDDCWEHDHDCDYWEDSLDTTEISAGFVFRF